MPIRRIVSDSRAKELPAAVIHVLLSGWAATPPEGESDSDGIFDLGMGSGFAAARDDDAPLPTWMLGTDQPIARLWLRHEVFLRAEAQRLGILPTCRVKGRPVFFGEWSCVPYQDRDDSDHAVLS